MADLEPGRAFASKDQEVDYWRKLAKQFKEELDETKEELEEFQLSSRELEQELDTQLEQEVKKGKELTLANGRLKGECDILREKLGKLQAESHKKTGELEAQLAKAEAHKAELQKYVRELEQSNDDLERTQRATVMSLEDFEMRLNEAIERNAFLESELDEKGTLVDTVQRLKDEARDLKSEIVVKQTTHKSSSSEHLPSAAAPTSIPGIPSPSSPSSSGNPADRQQGTQHTPTHSMQDSGYRETSGTTPTTPSTPLGKAPAVTQATPLTPSARISALNIVGDLLRKVGALESKLATCRNFVKEDSRGSGAGARRQSGGGGSPVNSPRSEQMAHTGGARSRTKRLSRGSSLPVQQGVKMAV